MGREQGGARDNVVILQKIEATISRGATKAKGKEDNTKKGNTK